MINAFARISLGLGAAAFLLLGFIHAFITIQDLWSARTFVPTDVAVVVAMKNATLALSPTANLWKFWMGYNLTHSLGLIVFGATFAMIAWRHSPLFPRSWFLQLSAPAVAGAYTVIAYQFFFPPAFLTAGAGFVLILVAVVTCLSRANRQGE